MVEYRDASGDHDRLKVDTADPDGVEIEFAPDGRPLPAVRLDRDAVAALVGQLSSWLRRTEAKP